jgi:catechol 2,3-dioxygenase-like lactoylglutathione lyase family enzyme
MVVVRLPAIALGALFLGVPGGAQVESGIRFHHVHMNVVDPARSASFYTSAFEGTRRVTVAGWEGVQAEDSYLLFTRVPARASTEWDTPIWHFGWNTPDAVADHQRLAARGVEFFRVPPPSGHLIGPDGNDVEIAPGRGGSSGGRSPTAFNHVHLMSDAPLCAADWYEKMLGLRRAPAKEPPPNDCRVPFTPRRAPANQIHEPNARLYAGDILVFIYPNQRLAAMTERAVDDAGPLASSRGRVLDHIAFSVPDVPGLLARLRGAGVSVLADVHDFGNTTLEAAMIEGPDRIAIELVERR